MKSKLENLLSFNDFKSDWISKNQTKTKGTETGLYILKESVEYNTLQEKIQRIEELISEQEDDSKMIDDVVNELRDSFIKMEKNGTVSENEIDELDDKHDGDWKSWILDVINIVSEDVIDSVLFVLGEDIEVNKESDNLEEDDDEIEDLEDLEDLDDETDCPDCEGTGLDDKGNECERCDGTGRVFIPDDIPPMVYDIDDDDEI